MAFPVTLNGRTYTLTDFEGTNYVDGLPDAFEDFVTHAGDIYNSTSTTSNSIGTGSKTFTVEANKPYQAGTPLRIADAAAPSTNFLDTVVTSYSGTTLVVNSIGYGGSGTKTSWTVNIGGAKTVDGTLGLSQGGTGATDAAGARTNIDVYSKADADSRFLNVSGEASNVTMTGDVEIGDASGDTLTVDATSTFNTSISVYGNGNAPITWGDTANAGFLSFDGSGNAIVRSATGKRLDFQVNANRDVFSLSNGSTVFNDSSHAQDFRIETDTQPHMFFVDSDENKIGINQSSPTATLDVQSSVADADGTLRVYQNVATGNPTVKILQRGEGGSAGTNQGLLIDIAGHNQGNGYILNTSVTNSNVNGGIAISPFSVKGIGTFEFRQGGVINQNGADSDFIIESENNTNMLFLDASVDRISMGTGESNDATLTVMNKNNNGTIHQKSGSNIANNGVTPAYMEMLHPVDTTSAGTQLSIPIFSQGGLWVQYQVELSVVTGEYNINTTARGGSAIFSFTSLTVVRSFSQQQVTGNISSVAIDSSQSSNMFIRVNFSNGYTAGASSRTGVLVHAKVLSFAPQYFELDNATMN